jgi:hypothetical protein
MDESLAPPPRFHLDQAPNEITALVEFIDFHRLQFHERVWGLTSSRTLRHSISSAAAPTRGTSPGTCGGS